MTEVSPPPTCHMSCVTCHMSHVTSHMLHVTCPFFCLDQVVKLVRGGSVINRAYRVYFLLLLYTIYMFKLNHKGLNTKTYAPSFRAMRPT